MEYFSFCVSSSSLKEYVSAPFLMKDQLKFDFRVYGVIRSINPLSIYVSREGMPLYIMFREIEMNAMLPSATFSVLASNSIIRNGTLLHRKIQKADVVQFR